MNALSFISFKTELNRMNALSAKSANSSRASQKSGRQLQEDLNRKMKQIGKKLKKEHPKLFNLAENAKKD